MASSTTTATSTYSPVIITSFPLNPLTTTFTPPADCSGIYRSSVDSGPNPYMIDLGLSCLPSGASTQATDYFSPGIDCPSGYYTACHDTNGVSTITTVTCCPFQGDISLSCVDLTTLSGVFATLFCTWIAPDTTTLAVTLSSVGGTTSTENTQFVSPQGLNAFGVRMVYESTDLITSASSTSSATTTTGTISSSSATAVSSSPASTGSTSSAKIAIAVVIPVVALAVLGAVYMWWRKRQQREPQLTGELHAESKPELPTGFESAELPSGPTTFSNSAQTTPPAELPVRGPR